jgi:hypothetical protein
MTTHKVCAVCAKSKPLAKFHLHPRAADGRQYRCKRCQHAIQAESARQKATAARQKWMRIAKRAEASR